MMLAQEGVTPADVAAALAISTLSPLVLITIGASPFSYTAPQLGQVAIDGGVATAVSVTRGGVAASFSLGVSAVMLGAGDVLTITYTTAPTTMNFLPI